MKTYVIANQKGGIGKTTTATALASILNDMGHKTLLIDTDIQRNSTDTYRAKVEGESTLFDVLLESENNRIPISEAIQHTEAGDIVAADPLLRRADAILDGMFRLKDALAKLEGYEYVVIDTNPSINAMLQNCLVAADEVIIPLTADRYGIQGLSDLYNTINATKKRQNINLKISGLLLIKYKNRTRLDREVKESLDSISEHMNTSVFNTTIRESVKAKEAQATRNTLINYDKKCTTFIDYMDFVNELLNKENN